MQFLKLIFLILFVFPAIAWAGEYNAIIYANFRAPSGEDIKEHWKPEIPDVGVDEVIRDFVVLERQGGKRVFHALVQTSDGEDGQVKRIKDYIRSVNGCTAPDLQGPPATTSCTTPIAQQIHAFWDKDVFQAFKKLWQARSEDNFYNVLARAVLRYPVDTTCDGEPCRLIVSITEAENTYGQTIDPSKILIPHKFSGK